MALRRYPGRLPSLATRESALAYLRRRLRGVQGVYQGQISRGRLDEERRHLDIVREGFGWGCLSPRELHRIKLVERGEKRPWCVDLDDLYDDELMEIFDFFYDCWYTQSVVLIFGQIFAQLEVS